MAPTIRAATVASPRVIDGFSCGPKPGGPGSSPRNVDRRPAFHPDAQAAQHRLPRGSQCNGAITDDSGWITSAKAKIRAFSDATAAVPERMSIEVRRLGPANRPKFAAEMPATGHLVARPG